MHYDTRNGTTRKRGYRFLKPMNHLAECAASCPGSPPCEISLSEVLRRFEQEAQSGICNTGRYRCAYLTWGKGPPLVFIHGMGDAALSYAPVMARLTGHFRCIAYALPAGGPDGARLDRYTHADLAADLFALLDHLGLRQSYVMGSSFGSMIALTAAHQRPERLPRLALQGGFARRPLAPAEVLLARLMRHCWVRQRAMPLHRVLRRHMAFASFASRPAEVWDFFEQNTTADPLAVLAYRALMIHVTDLRPLLPAIRQPVLLVCGDGDHLVGRQCEQELEEGLPNSGRVVLPDCGHFPHFTDPEPFAQLLHAFFTPRPKQSPIDRPSCFSSVAAPGLAV